MKKHINLLALKKNELSQSKMRNVCGGKQKTTCYCVCRCGDDGMGTGNGNGARRAAY